MAANANAHFEPKVLSFLQDTSSIVQHRDSGNARARTIPTTTPTIRLPPSRTWRYCPPAGPEGDADRAYMRRSPRGAYMRRSPAV